MDFSYIEEQQLLADSVNRLIEKEYDFEKRKTHLAQPEGFSRDTWNTFAEMGLLGLSVPAEYGGFGATTVDTMIVMEAIGRGLVVEPYFSTAIMGTNLLTLGAPEALKQALLPQIVEGKLLLAVATTERHSRYELANVALAAKRDGAGYVLDGAKSVVLHGGAADKIIVSARTAGGARDAKGITLFIVDRKAPGVAVRDYPTIDGLRAAEITFKGVKVGADAITGDTDNGLPLLQRVADIGIAALVRGSSGRHAVAQYRDPRIPQDPPAVRRADRPLPGAATPHGRHGDPGGDGKIDGLPGLGQMPVRGRGRPPPQLFRRQGTDRPGRAASSASRRSSCTAAWA